MRNLYLSIVTRIVLILSISILSSNLYSQNQNNNKLEAEEAKDPYIIYPEALTLINAVANDISDIFSNTLSLNTKENISFTIAIKDSLQSISLEDLNSVHKETIKSIVTNIVDIYDKKTVSELLSNNNYKLLYYIVTSADTVQQNFNILCDILSQEEFLDFLSDDTCYQYIDNASFLESLNLLNKYSDDSTLSDIIFKNPAFFIEINNLATIINGMKKYFNEDELCELFNSSIFLKYLHQNSVDFLKNIQFFSKYYNSKLMVEKLKNNPESISFKLNKNIPSTIMDDILTLLSKVLSSEEIFQLIDIDFFTTLDLSFKTIPEDTTQFYRNLKYIFILLSKDRTIYLESFPELIKYNFSYFVDLATSTEDTYIIEKKILEFKYNHSITYKLFELQGVYDFVPVFFELFFDNINSDSPSKYISTKPYIIDTLDSWIEEEYLTQEFNSFLEEISPIDSLDLLLVLYILHNNIDTSNLIKIIKANPYKLFVFKDFIYTISLYLKDSNLIKKFLSNPTMIMNFFNTTWNEETSIEYFKHILSITNLVPEKDRINFILGINTFHPILPSDFKAHIELVLLLKDQLKDNFHTVLGENYDLVLNLEELKSLSSKLFLKSCSSLMSKDL